MSKFQYNNRRSNYIMSPLLQNIYPPQQVSERVPTPIPELKKERSVRDLIPLFEKNIKEESISLKVLEKEEPITRSLSEEDLKPFPTENKIMNKLLKLSRFKSVK